jgi:hypothetical protein
MRPIAPRVKDMESQGQEKENLMKIVLIKKIELKKK